MQRERIVDMNTLTLDADVLQNLTYIAQDESMMKKLSRYMRHLLKTKQDDTLMSEADFYKKLEHSSHQAASGKYIEMKQDESVNQFVDRLLCM